MADGNRLGIQLDLETFVHIGRLMLIPTILKDPQAYRGIAAVALLGALAIQDPPDAGKARRQFTDEEKRRIDNVLEFFVARFIRQERWTTRDDPVFSAIYHLLQDRLITRAEAVDLASPLLEVQKTAEQDAFRSRVNRWATARGLALPRHTKRTPRKLNGRNQA